MANQSLCNVLLIDDDLLVLDDLQSMIDWQANGFNIVACAHNGQAALEIMETLSVDLIIADIEMPLMNGLDFLKQVHQKDNSIVALLLTAYSRFDYAREAVALGVFNYILKYELTPEVLLDNLIQMRQLRNHQQQHHKYAMHQTLHQCLELNQECNFEEWNTINLEHKTIFIVKVNAALALKQYDQSNRNDSLSDKVIENEGLMQLLPLKGVAYSANEWEVTFIFTQPWDCYRLNRDLLDSVLLLCQKSFQSNCQAMVSSCLNRSDVYSLYHAMKVSEYRLFYFPLNQCFDFKEVVSQDNNVTIDFNREFEVLDQAEISVIPLQIKSCLSVMKQYQMNVVENYALIRLLLHQLQRVMHLQLPTALYLEDYSQWQTIRNYEQLENFVLAYLHQLETSNGKKYGRKVIEMMNYIQKNCGNEDVLESLAEYLSMNREYMAKIFKKETGDSLSNHLLNCRMKKAYHLLTHTHYKIYEIAELCGYNSSQYFSMVFTKYYHCSPSDVMNAGNQ